MSDDDKDAAIHAGHSDTSGGPDKRAEFRKIVKSGADAAREAGDSQNFLARLRDAKLRGGGHGGRGDLSM